MGADLHSKERHQQRPQPPAVSLTWHAGKFKVHKLHQRYSLIFFRFPFQTLKKAFLFLVSFCQSFFLKGCIYQSILAKLNVFIPCTGTALLVARIVQRNYTQCLLQSWCFKVVALLFSVGEGSSQQQGLGTHWCSTSPLKPWVNNHLHFHLCRRAHTPGSSSGCWTCNQAVCASVSI